MGRRKVRGMLRATSGVNCGGLRATDCSGNGVCNLTPTRFGGVIGSLNVGYADTRLKRTFAGRGRTRIVD